MELSAGPALQPESALVEFTPHNKQAVGIDAPSGGSFSIEFFRRWLDGNQTLRRNM